MDQRRARLVAILWLTGLGVGATMALAATYLLAVQTTRGRLLDGASLRGAVDNRSRVSDVVERLLDVVSVTTLLAAGVLLAGIALVRARRELALAAVMLVIGANATSQLLKRVVLERPDLGLYESTPATLNSLPSGHSTVAFSLAVALVLVLPVPLRPTAAALGVAYASVTAVATLSAGWHRPSDSVASFLVVGVWAALAGGVLVARPMADGGAGGSTDPRHHAVTARRLGVAAAYLLAFGALVTGVILTTQLDTYGPPAQVLAYLAGAGAVSGTGAAIMAAMLAVMHLVAPTQRREQPASPPAVEADHS